MSVDARARAGLFLAMQYPVEVPGVIGVQLPAHRDHRDPRRGTQAADCSSRNCAPPWTKLSIDPAFAERNLNEGFSGGEKKRHEILQLQLLKPKIAILDETDSGLDIDALRWCPRASTRSARTRPRRAADHPLHPDPAVREAGLRARLRRRPDRRAGRPRARREARGERLREVHRPRRPRWHDPGRRAGSARTSRSSSARSAAAAAGLPGQREHLAEAAARSSMRCASTTSGTTPTSPGPCTRSARRPPRRTRARGSRSRVHRRPRRAEIVFTKNASEALNLVAYAFEQRATSAARRSASGSVPATRSSSPRWSTTPTSCRGSCSASAPARRCAGSASPTTAGWTCRTSTS